MQMIFVQSSDVVNIVTTTKVNDSIYLIWAQANNVGSVLKEIEACFIKSFSRY